MHSPRSFLVLIAGAAALAALVLALSRPWPIDPDALLQSGLQAVRDGQVEPARAAARRLQESGGTGDGVHLLYGGAALRAGDPALALDHLLQIDTEGPLRSDALLWTGEAFYRVGRLADAEAFLRPLAIEHPASADAHRWLGSIYYDMGAMNEAVAHMDRVIALAPDDYRPHHLLGVIRLDFDQFAEAAKHLRSALERRPPPDRERLIRIDLATALVGNLDFIGAIDALESVPRDARTLALEAECHWSLQQTGLATELVEQAIALDPELRSAIKLRAEIFLQSGRLGDAIAQYERILQKSPHDYEVRYQLALGLAQSGATDRSQAEMRRMEESRTLHERVHELNQRAISEPDNADVRDELARLSRELGRPDLSRMWQLAAQQARARLSRREPPRSAPGSK